VSAPFRLEVLAKHDREPFACGQPALDAYFKKGVSQDVRRRVTACFVAVEAETGVVAGYYTIAATSIQLSALPPETSQRLPRYPMVPAVRIGRLAIDEHFQKRGLAAALLADAARRSLQSPPAVFALVVDAKDEHAARFYEHHGFQRLGSPALVLFMPLATAAKAWLGSE
jgi:ribosomal protein S18 acetylase RimI-like enzyme